MDLTNEIGITTGCDCGDTLEETLRNIKNAGFSHVMLDRYKDLNADIETTKRFGLKIPFVHLDGRLSNNLWEQGETGDAYVAQVMREIEILGRHNIDAGVIHHSHNNDIITPARTPNEQALANLRKIVEHAEKYRTKLLIENTDHMEHLAYLLDNVQSPYLGFCYDSGHHNLFHPEQDLLGKYGDRLGAVHLHDNRMDYFPGQGWDGDLHLLPFDGKVDFDKVARGIAQSAYNGGTMLETNRGAKIRKTYDHMTPSEYLQKARTHGKRLSKLIVESRQGIERDRT